jgi:hypothetical protein
MKQFIVLQDAFFSQFALTPYGRRAHGPCALSGLTASGAHPHNRAGSAPRAAAAAAAALIYSTTTCRRSPTNS